MRCYAVRNRELGRVLCALVCGFGLAGCGGGEVKPPPLFPVTGTVTYQGKAVPGATVVFLPTAKQKAKDPPLFRPFGVADDEGNYSLMWSEDHEGAPAGQYKVAISAVAPATDDEEGDSQTKPANAVPDKYGNPATSGFSATVEDGGENVFNFELK